LIAGSGLAASCARETLITDPPLGSREFSGRRSSVEAFQSSSVHDIFALFTLHGLDDGVILCAVVALIFLWALKIWESKRIGQLFRNVAAPVGGPTPKTTLPIFKFASFRVSAVLWAVRTPTTDVSVRVGFSGLKPQGIRVPFRTFHRRSGFGLKNPVFRESAAPDIIMHVKNIENFSVSCSRRPQWRSEAAAQAKFSSFSRRGFGSMSCVVH